MRTVKVRVFLYFGLTLDLNATHNLINVPLLRADFDRETPFLNDRHSNEEIQSFNDLVNKNTPTESQEKPKHIPLKKTGMAATTKKPAKSKQTKLDESVEEQNQLLADANKATSVVANGLNKSIFAMVCFAIKKCRELQRKIQNVATRYFPYFLDNAFVKRKLWPVYEIIWAW